MSEPDEVDVIVMDNRLIPDFEKWLDSRGLYLSEPVPIRSETTDEIDWNRFVWPKEVKT